jgi:hypothetical protein
VGEAGPAATQPMIEQWELGVGRLRDAVGEVVV